MTTLSAIRGSARNDGKHEAARAEFPDTLSLLPVFC
jgi:hypothetical protein